jgi:N utilization substance protein B
MADTDATPRPRPPGPRRRAREAALAALYRADVLGLDYPAALVSLPEVFALNEEQYPPEGRVGRRIRGEALAYAHDLLSGLALEAEEIDATIAELARGWSLERLTATDRCLLRLALWELRQGQEPRIVVNEAVEIAHQYGGEDSARFVNGVLGAWVDGRTDGADRNHETHERHEREGHAHDTARSLSE